MLTIIQAWENVGVVLQVVGVLAVTMIAVSVLILAIKRKTTDQALTEWQNLATARLETIHQERGEKEQLRRELTSLQKHLGECEKLRNDFASHNLRLNARLSSYEKCINSLERALDRPQTNFDDPFKDVRG